MPTISLWTIMGYFRIFQKRFSIGLRNISEHHNHESVLRTFFCIRDRAQTLILNTPALIWSGFIQEKKNNSWKHWPDLVWFLYLFAFLFIHPLQYQICRSLPNLTKFEWNNSTCMCQCRLCNPYSNVIIIHYAPPFYPPPPPPYYKPVGWNE